MLGIASTSLSEEEEYLVIKYIGGGAEGGRALSPLVPLLILSIIPFCLSPTAFFSIMTNVCPPNHAEYWGAGNARGGGGGAGK